MKPLFSIAAVLSVIWMVRAAPQLLSLNSSTTNELKDLTTTTISEIASSEIAEGSSSLSLDNEEISSKDVSITSSDTSTESFKERVEYDETTDARMKDRTEFTDDSTKSKDDTFKSTSISSGTGEDFTNAATSTLKPTENSESEIPITRYVPPLDPIRHMLMMADIKGMSHFSHFVPKVNLKAETTTTDNPTSEEIEMETNVNAFLTNISHTAEVIHKTTEDSKNLVAETTLAASTESNSKEQYETTMESSTEKLLKMELTENPISDETSEKADDDRSSFDVTTEKENSHESLEKIIANESSEKVISEPSEADENEEKDAEETTITDFTTTPSKLFFESLELIKSVFDDDDNTSNEHSSTLTPINRTEEINFDSTEKPTETEEIILKNNDAEINVNEKTDEMDTTLNVEETIDEADKKTTINEEGITLTTLSSTEEVMEAETITSSDKLLKNNDDFKTHLPVSTSESTTISAISSEKETEIYIADTSTTKEIAESTFIISTTEVPETTSKENRDTAEPELESDRKNISLDDELEFRAVKFPQNVSKVSYIENDTIDIHDSAIEDNSESIGESEISTQSIFTTIADILFSSSSSTEATTKSFETTETESPSETTQTEKQPLKIDSDSDVILFNDTSEALKVQPLTPELDSILVDDTTRSSIEAIETELEELLKSEKEVSGENGGNIPVTTMKVETTTPSTSKAEVTTDSFIPSALTSTLTSVTESAEVEVIETSDNENVEETETSSEETASEYSFDNKNRYVSGNNTDMVAAVQFLHYHDKASSEQCFKLVNAHWNYATNLTEENKKKQLEQTLEYSLYHKAAWKNATSFAWKTFNDTLLRRWFKSLSVLGNAALPEDKLNEFNKLRAEMKNTYSTAKICTYVSPEDVKKGQILQEKDCNLTLEPDLQRILTKSRDYDELVHVWKSWRDAAGKPIREKYLRFVELGNEAARINGFFDIGDMWKEAYESETFESDLEQLWEQLRPLYEHLHAYVRRRLIQQYGTDKIKENGPIPAHLFGNMWAQSWVSLLDITQPFPGKPSVDVTPIMQAKNMTANEMFKISEEFFISLGLKSMPETFWKYSLIEKPKDREIICHASAWDFCNGKDYRIKQCTDITMEDLVTVHHEMGHIQYFLQYARQPAVFREGANPGFHEAIGDVMALSVSTPRHLQSIGLLDDVADDPEGDLNFLLYTALDKVSFLPTGYLIELWRWGLFSGDIKPEEMNTKWWELRQKYQGVCPPVKRTDTDFDPGAKFHIPGHVPYIRYFVSFVIQFQFHKVLCDAAGHTGPLYKCDIYRSKEAGQILSQVMELGSSEHWSEAMKIMTGGATNKMDAGPILEYFEPLLDFLKQQNENETLGWRSDDPTICP